MKTIKLTKEQTELMYQSVSALIREETKDMVLAESKDLATLPYQERITKLNELKTILDKQL